MKSEWEIRKCQRKNNKVIKNRGNFKRITQSKNILASDEEKIFYFHINERQWYLFISCSSFELLKNKILQHIYTLRKRGIVFDRKNRHRVILSFGGFKISLQSSG